MKTYLDPVEGKGEARDQKRKDHAYILKSKIYLLVGGRHGAGSADGAGSAGGAGGAGVAGVAGGAGATGCWRSEDKIREFVWMNLVLFTT
jgi:hypothetical protein